MKKIDKSPITPKQFVASLDFDFRLAPYDLTASMVHVQMLARQKIISKSDGVKLVKGLKALKAKVDRGVFLGPGEDIHFAIEGALFKKCGPVAGRMHTARSRNDQVVTALRLYMRDHLGALKVKILTLSKIFVAKAAQNKSAIMPGFTHLQPGQPIVVAHHLLTYGWMLLRDWERIDQTLTRTNVLPLGAAAMAGTSFNIDRFWVAKKLGFKGIIENSIDAVSDRDFLVDFLASASLIMVHLSRFCEELIIWSNPAFGFVTLSDPFVTGSSIMPQKRNPDMAELIRGKTGHVVGHLVSMLTMLKAQPLAYNRDLQEDKPPVFATMDTLESSLDVMIPMVKTMKIHGDVTQEICRMGHLLATDVADALVRRGMPFRKAHGLVGLVVRYAQKQRLTLENVPLDVWRTHSALFGSWIHDILSLTRAVDSRKSRGGTSKGSVDIQLKKIQRILKECSA